VQPENVRVRVNFGAREVEISGSNEEVAQWWERLEPILKDIGQPKQRSPQTANGLGEGRSEEDSRYESFGEYFNEFPSSITDVDKMLAAAHFVQSTDPGNLFTTAQASKLLSEQGIKLANPSQCVKQNAEKKHVFTQNGKYRVSKSGIDRLTELTRTTP
jgi:hypothetical protein